MDIKTQANKKNSGHPEIVVVLKDGIRGHESQSEGVAWWLSKLAGASLVRFSVPPLSGLARFLRYKIESRSLKPSSTEAAGRWVDKTQGGEELLRHVDGAISSEGIEGRNVLFLSAGSSSATWCLALARVIGGRSCTVMTPSVLGTGPFDFAIVPEHDFPDPAPNTLVTLGAPNMIRSGLLIKEASILASSFPSGAGPKWGIMVGGEDANYTVPPGWIDEVIKPLLAEAETEKAEVFITTSRRTLPETEERIAKVAGGFTNVRMMISGAKDPWNPVPGMLGFCSRIFCTEDSVSMISEAATAGHVVNILGVDRRKGFRKTFQGLTREMIKSGIVPASFLWGAPRFDLMIESFCQKNLAARFDVFSKKDQIRELEQQSPRDICFNEARRAAEWIIKEWGL